MTTEPARPRRTLVVLRLWYAKMLYVIAGIAIYYFGGGLAPTDGSRGILRSILVFLLFVLAARIFRSVDEPGPEPRAWWRMTGRAFAGWVLGVIFGLATLALLVYEIGISVTPSAHDLRAQEPLVAVTFVLFGALAVLYLTSSVRLRALERAARIAEQRGEK